MADSVVAHDDDFYFGRTIDKGIAGDEMLRVMKWSEVRLCQSLFGSLLRACFLLPALASLVLSFNLLPLFSRCRFYLHVLSESHQIMYLGMFDRDPDLVGVEARRLSSTIII